MVDVYFKADVARGLAAVNVAQQLVANAHGNGNIEYMRGCSDTARSVALVFGLTEEELRGTLCPGASRQ